MYLHLLERLMEIADADERYELRIVTQYEEIKNQIGIFRQEGRRAACVWSPESEKRSLIFYSVRAFRIRGTGRTCFRGQNAGLRLFCGGPAVAC